MGVSYSGNTADSKSAYVGSIPTAPASLKIADEAIFCYAGIYLGWTEVFL